MQQVIIFLKRVFLVRHHWQYDAAETAEMFKNMPPDIRGGGNVIVERCLISGELRHISRF